MIYEQSPVVRIERGESAVVHTQAGQVKARFVIVDCNAYIGDLEPQLSSRAMPCGTQIITTEPLGECFAEILPQDYCVVDKDYLLDYFRFSVDHRMIYGGGVVYCARDPAHVEFIIRPKMLETFPQLAGVRIDYAWTGNFLLTLNRLPHKWAGFLPTCITRRAAQATE